MFWRHAAYLHMSSCQRVLHVTTFLSNQLCLSFPSWLISRQREGPGFESQTVWPDDRIKSGPFFSTLAQNVAKEVFSQKRGVWNSKKITAKFLGQFCKIICSQNFSKVAQPGHTGPRIKSETHTCTYVPSLAVTYTAWSWSTCIYGRNLSPLHWAWVQCRYLKHLSICLTHVPTSS